MDEQTFVPLESLSQLKMGHACHFFFLTGLEANEGLTGASQPLSSLKIGWKTGP